MKTRTVLEVALRIELEGVDAQLATEVLLDLAREWVPLIRAGDEEPGPLGPDEPLRARFIEVRGERLTMTDWASGQGEE